MHTWLFLLLVYGSGGCFDYLGRAVIIYEVARLSGVGREKIAYYQPQLLIK